MLRRYVLGALLALGACADDSRSSAPLLNRCAVDMECTTRGTFCDQELGICVQGAASVPYDYQVQITPVAATDAGPLAAASTQRSTLTDAGMLATITVAPAVYARGSVLSAEGVAMEAELVFTPRDANALGGARSVFTRGATFEAQLEPGRTYGVLIYPRGADSAKYPPYSFELPMGPADQSASFTYPTLVSLKGHIKDENDRPPPNGLRVKTRLRNRLLASSSIGTVNNGNFEVFLPQAALSAPAEHELALDLSGASLDGAALPQNVQIVFDMTKMRADGEWTMPVLPRTVLFSGTVESAQLMNASFNLATVNAQLTFISAFPLPPGNMNQSGVDWCQLRLPGAPRDTFRCSAYVSTSVTDRQFAARLLPGTYDVVIAPSGAAPTLQRLATQIETGVKIQNQPDGMQSGNTFQLSPVTQYRIVVTSPGDRPMPSVVVSANALGVQADLPEVALYNRSDRQVTLYDGRTRLAVDIGYYDLLASPPEGTGFASVLLFNGRIAPTAQVSDPLDIDLLPGFALRPQLPVVMRGSAVVANGDKVAQANVDAYALVPDVEGGPDRAVRIARTTTDRDGKFALQMPPRIGSDDLASSDGGVNDAAADAGLDAQR